MRKTTLASTMAWAGLSPLTSVRVPFLGPVSSAFLLLALILWMTFSYNDGSVRLGYRCAAVVIPLGVAGTLLIVLSTYPNSSDSHQSTVLIVRAGVAIVASLIVAAFVVAQPTSLKWTFNAFLLGSGLLSLSTLLLDDSVGGRAIGLGQNPVEVGGVLAASTAGLIFKLNASGWERVASVGLLFAMIPGILLSQSATSIAAIGAAVALVTFLSVGSSLTRLITGALVGVFIFVGLRSFSGGLALIAKVQEAVSGGVFPDASFSVDSLSTLQSRVISVQYGIDRALLHPFAGAGFASADAQVLRQLQPHNIIVLAWISGGAIFALLWLYLLWRSSCFVFRARRGSLSTYPALSCAVVAAWCAALTGPQLVQNSWLLMVSLGVTASYQLARFPSSLEFVASITGVDASSSAGNREVASSAERFVVGPGATSLHRGRFRQ